MYSGRSRWKRGCTGATALRQEICACGYSGSCRLVRGCRTSFRAKGTAAASASRPPAPREVTRWIIADPAADSKRAPSLNGCQSRISARTDSSSRRTSLWKIRNSSKVSRSVRCTRRWTSAIRCSPPRSAVDQLARANPERRQDGASPGKSRYSSNTCGMPSTKVCSPCMRRMPRGSQSSFQPCPSTG